MKFFSIILATLISKAAASPSGASACPAGAAAPGGPHLSGMPGLDGDLSEGDYFMTVGGVEVSDGDEIESPLDFDITVTAAGDGFRGILIRVGGASVDQVTSTDLTAPAGACGDVGSVTHSEPSLKTTGTASVSLDGDALLEVDISVVVDNNAAEGISTFYYSSFTINAVAMTMEPPEMTESPETTEPPEETEPPVVTEPPVTTESPETPETTEPPVETESPEMTEAPETTEPPETTEAPVAIENPETTTAPSVSPPLVDLGSGSPSMVPVMEPTSDAFTHSGIAAVFTGALVALVV